ncbi:MAG TPA: GcrA family cell cycle regulator [Acetobacteraceae bacterium]|nr:GcrA family cell cycle regulator [Acetobacteraceae bacterium]
MEWTEESIQRLRAFWTEGLSTAEIGRRLGVSKNAVVGKAHRLDLTARPSPIRWDAVGDTTRRRSRRPVATPRPEGPTLPPLSSIAGTAQAPAAARPRPARPAPAAATAQPMISPPSAAPRVTPAPVAAPRPIAAVPLPALPRLQAVAPRPYGRVVTCCWPLGEPGTKSFRFCDAASVPGKPYCDEHAQLAYVKVRDRREDAA